jgi:hypothetical protein
MSLPGPTPFPSISPTSFPIEEKPSRRMEKDFSSAAQSVQEMLRRGMVTYGDVAPFFRGKRPEGSGVVFG